MLPHIFNPAKEVIVQLKEHGEHAYFVGGCVRDVLLHREIGDIDIATSATPDKMLQIFDTVIPVGIEHGTVIVRLNHVSYEVTTFRKDGTYSDQRHPDTVLYVDQIDEDLQRRDFTINALAMDIDGNIIDLYGGQADLQKKLIRTVGNGVERFTEDPLRILRALRFSSQLGFKIEAQTLHAIQEVQSQMRNLAVERITNELAKLAAGTYAAKGFMYLRQTKVYEQLPVMIHYPYIMERIPNHMKPIHSLGGLTAFFHMLAPEIRLQTWITGWKCSNRTKKEAMNLVEAISYAKTHGMDRWLVYRLMPELQTCFLTITSLLNPNEEMDETYFYQLFNQLPIRSKQEMNWNGNDLSRCFPDWKKGRWMQETLLRIEKEIVMGRLDNSKIKIKEWLQWNPPVID